MDEKINVKDIVRKKGKKKITMLTCYDYSFAKILDLVGIDIILVGDSLANVLLGFKTTKDISFREMFNHTLAVSRAVKKSLVVADMPYRCYQQNKKKAVYYAEKFVDEAKADAVKVEWFKGCIDVVKSLRKNKIEVMGHIGLTPQSIDKLGGFKVQGKDAYKAKELLDEALLLEDEGVFSIVLECIPSRVSEIITEYVSIPTIGIGSGSGCDGQVLVLYDVLGLYEEKRLKFVRRYANLSSGIIEAVNAFVKDVKEGKFPSEKESFSISEDEFMKFKEMVKNNFSKR